MAKGLYRSCQACGLYFHPDELLYVPEYYPRAKQKRLCLEDAEFLLAGLIKIEECNRERRLKRRAA